MRQYLSALLWIAGTTIVVAGAQVITTRAAAERRAVTKLNIELVENTVRVRELEAELRTRAGLPELQRWNDAVFQLAAPQGGQILRSPVQLASFAARPEAEPKVQFAVAGDLPSAGSPLPAGENPVPAAGGTARLVRTSYGEAAAPAAAAPQGLPDDLLADLPADPAEPQGGMG